MKVCLLNDSFPPVIDGVANTVMNYASVLTSLGDEVMVATPEYPGADYSSYPYKVVPYHSMDTTKIVTGYRTGNPFDVKAMEAMSNEKPDLIHSHCPFSSSIMARMLRNQVTAPIVFTYHTKFDYDIARAVKAKSIQEGVIKFLVDNIAACDEVWTVSKGAGENLKSLGYQGDYIVMNNGVDFAKGRVDDETVQKATAGYDLPEELPVFLFVGRLMNYKGLPLIVDALKLLSNEGKDFRMVFVGGGADAAGLQKKVLELGLSLDVTDDSGKIQATLGTCPGKVIFTGPIHDRTMLRAWNTRADLFLFPSTYDTNGIVVREAAACGLASILIQDSCAAEGITDGRNGFLIEETAESMAALLSKLHGEMNVMAEAGQKAMDEIYISWEDAVKVARERYLVVLEKSQQIGTVPRKIEPMDYFIEAAGYMQDFSESVLGVSRSMKEELREIMRNAQEELRDNYYAAQDELRENVRAAKEELRENYHAAQAEMRQMKEEREQDAERFKAELRSAGDTMKQEFQDLGQRILRNLEEYSQFWDDGQFMN